MNIKKIVILSFIISGAILSFVLLKQIQFSRSSHVEACSAFNPNPSIIPTIKVCDKPYYQESELVAYFRDYKTDEAYYLTNDWCVVKGILWWGGVFAKYPVKTETLQASIQNIFPEPQIYFGLVPIALLGTYYPTKNFTTKTLKPYGYFTIDNPFKNIYGDNKPTPPKFVRAEEASLAFIPPQATNAKILFNRMNDLQNIFENNVLKGDCLKWNISQELKYACDYFRNRDNVFSPSYYYSFKKNTQYYTAEENY